MQRVEVVRIVAGSPQAVWDVYTDHAGWADWGGVVAARIERPGDPVPNGTGCVRVLGPRPFGAHEEILAFEPPKRMTYSLVKGGLPMRDHFGEVLFEPLGEDGAATRVVWRCRFESKLPGLGGVFRAGITRLFRRVLDGMAARHFPD
ncbi:MAG: SRPBCC family protein [Myxococcota bacterium]